MSRVFGVTNTENCAFLKIMGFIAKKKKEQEKLRKAKNNKIRIKTCLVYL
jgi:hypothetical protein